MTKIKIILIYSLAIYTLIVLTGCPISNAVGDEETYKILQSLDQLMANNLEKLERLNEKVKNDTLHPEHLQIIKMKNEEIQRKDTHIDSLEEQLRHAKMRIQTLQSIVQSLSHDESNQVRLRQQIAQQKQQIAQQQLEIQGNRTEIEACQEALRLKAMRDAVLREKSHHLIDTLLHSHTEDA